MIRSAKIKDGTCQETAWPERLLCHYQTVWSRGGDAKHFTRWNMEKWPLLIKSFFSPIIFHSFFFHFHSLKKNLVFKYPQQCYALFCIFFLGLLTSVNRLMGEPVIEADAELSALM